MHGAMKTLGPDVEIVHWGPFRFWLFADYENQGRSLQKNLQARPARDQGKELPPRVFAVAQYKQSQPR
jgi:hypothetical protein